MMLYLVLDDLEKLLAPAQICNCLWRLVFVSLRVVCLRRNRRSEFVSFQLESLIDFGVLVCLKPDEQQGLQPLAQLLNAIRIHLVGIVLVNVAEAFINLLDQPNKLIKDECKLFEAWWAFCLFLSLIILAAFRLCLVVLVEAS